MLEYPSTFIVFVSFVFKNQTHKLTLSFPCTKNQKKGIFLLPNVLVMDTTQKSCM